MSSFSSSITRARTSCKTSTCLFIIQGEEDLDQWFIVMKKVISKEHNQSGDDNLHLCLCVKHELT